MCAERSESIPSSDTAGEEWEEWLKTVEGVLDETVEREGKLECEFDNLQLGIPTSWGEETEHAQWSFNGTVRIQVEGDRRPLAAWLKWWYERMPSSENSE